MKRVLERYGVSFAAVIGVIVLGIAGAGYVLANQRFYLPHWVPIIGSDFVDYTADFNSAKAVVPGQGQTVAISGVTVGEIGSVKLVNGRGRVTMKIRRQYASRIHTDASAALRPRTPLQDMVIQLDPGTKAAPLMKAGGNIPAARTMSPVELEEVLSQFDEDTRAYLAILLQQGGKGLDGDGGAQLRAVLKRFEPTVVYGTKIAKALKSRNAEAERAVTNLNAVATALGKNNKALASVITNGDTTLQAISEQQADLAGVVQKAPNALKKTEQLLNTGGKIAGDLGKASTKLERPTRKFDAGLANLTTFLNAATPVIKNDLRPFARDVQAPLATLRPAVDNLASAGKNVSTGTGVLRQLFDGLTYEPKGEDLSALTLAGYVGHAGMSIASMQDAAGAVPRALLWGDCDLINTLTGQVRPLSPLARIAIDDLGIPSKTSTVSSGQSVSSACAVKKK